MISYLPEVINISLFSNGKANPVPFNPEDLINLDLGVEEIDYNRCFINTLTESRTTKRCRLTGAIKVGETNEAIIIDLGSDKITCSPNREIMLFDGTYKLCKDISKSDRLMGITSPVNILKVENILLPEAVSIYDIVTDPDCNNYLLVGGAFIGKIKRGFETLETLSLNPVKDNLNS